MKITALCILLYKRKVVSKIEKTQIILPGGEVDEDSAQDQLMHIIHDKCKVVSTKPVLLFIDKEEKKAIYFAYVNVPKSDKQENEVKLNSGWDLSYTDVMKEQIDKLASKDRVFYSILSISMSLVKLILDKSNKSQKDGERAMKEQIKKIAKVFHFF